MSAELLPSPAVAFESFRDLAASGELGEHTLVSFYREIVGLIASAIGTALGIGMARIEWLRPLIRPVVMFLYPMPKSALIPVLLLWFGIGDMSKIAAIFLGCLLPVVTSAFNGARGVEPPLVWSARSLGTSRAGVLWKVILPAALPEILSGVRIALALSQRRGALVRRPGGVGRLSHAQDQLHADLHAVVRPGRPGEARHDRVHLHLPGDHRHLPGRCRRS